MRKNRFPTFQILMVVVGLAACTAVPLPPPIVMPPRVVDTGCNWTAAIYIDPADVLTKETAASILAHDKAGAVRCGWKPNIKK